MKANAPWSVKGIERDARETAKEAAKREGMTVGEWLNQMIYSAGDADLTNGDIEGLKLRDIVTAIEHLHGRLGTLDQNLEASAGDTNRTIGTVVERLQRLERENSAPGMQADVIARLERIENDRGERERVDALKALEKAVAQVAVQFSNSQQTILERLDSVEARAERSLEFEKSGAADASEVGYLKDAIDGLQSRLSRTERTLSDRSQPNVADGSGISEETENRLRVLGEEIKRGEDQIRAFDRTIGKLAQQTEAAERRSAEGIQKTAETLSEIREKLGTDLSTGADRDDVAAMVSDQMAETASRIDRLQNAFDKMLARLDGDNPASVEADRSEAPSPTHDECALELNDPLPSDDEPDAPVIAEQDAIEDPSDQFAHEASGLADEEINSDLTPDDTTDDDFFSFADEIDATIEEAPADDDGGDEFSFELDTGDSADEATQAIEFEDETDNLDDDGAALLSEVQAAFDDSAAQSDPLAADDDLDELLAGLDSQDVSEEDTPRPVSLPESQEAQTIDDGTAIDTDQPVKSDDYIRSVRKKAGEDAKRALEEHDAATRRRKLTPKQKAILAARIRKKRLAQQSNEAATASDTIENKQAIKEALNSDKKAPSDETELSSDSEDDSESQSLLSRISSRLTSLPFIGRAPGSLDEDLDDVDPSNGDRAALKTLKSTASARPVTLALGIAIFLAAGLLFFFVKDLIWPSDRGQTGPRPTLTTESTIPSTINADGSLLETPAPPSIDPEVLYRDAMTGLNAAGNDAETTLAIEKLERSALLGHPPAQLQLGELYKTGQGVEQDLTQARTWFKRAANGGNVLAMHRAGVMTARGEGGEANTPEAVAWFEQAANRGLVDSQYNLGAIYHPSDDGDSTGIKDASKAYYWYSLAANNGDDQARPLAAGVAAMMSDAQRTEVDQRVSEWEALPSDAAANRLVVTG